MAKSKEQIRKARKTRRAQLKEANDKLKFNKDWYPTSDEKKNFVREVKAPRRQRLRSGLKAGQVLILLTGRFRGRRVIFLKQLETGLLLVTGPYKLNGVPLKRVNQAYVIPTKTSVGLGSIKHLDTIGDDSFTLVDNSIENRTDFFEAPETKRVIKYL